MDSETRAALAALGDTMNAGFARMDAGFAGVDAGFARMDRYFQIQHKWMQGWIDELRHERELRRRTADLSTRVVRLEQEVDSPRDYISREIAEIRLELFELRYEAWQTDYLKRELAALTDRVDRLAPRQQK